MTEAIRDVSLSLRPRPHRWRPAVPELPSDPRAGVGTAVNTHAAASARQTPPAC